MTQWYYADANRQRQGPVPATELVRCFHQGLLRLDSLVWREGLAEWQALRDFTQELALHEPPAETFYTPAAAAMPASPQQQPPAPLRQDDVQAEVPVFSSATPESPYAPPQAAVASDEAFHAGGEVVQAGFWKRAAAYFLDAVVVVIAAQIVQMVVMMGFFGMNLGAMTGDPQSVFASTGGLLMLASLYLLPLLISVGYYAAFHASSKQATLGKMAVGIKVVRGDGRRISLARAIARYFATLLSTVILGIGFLMAAFTQRKQALHDLVCDTLVVDRWAYSAHPEWQRPGLGTVTVVILAVAGVLVLGLLALLALAMGLAFAAT